MKPIATYYYRGEIERVQRNGRYHWCLGYSENGPSGSALYPWMTVTECRADAASRGMRAVFFRPKGG